jgi:putative flippase GtrA
MTDWDKELAKIDKQLASMSDADLVAEPARPALPAGKQVGKPASRPSAAAAPAEPAPAGSRAATWALYGRIGLSVALGVGMMFWPYDARCGAGLTLYLGAVLAVVVSGVWSAVWSWRHRASRLHMLSLLLVLWGLILGSLDVLPRVGYAKITLPHQASWVCK